MNDPSQSNQQEVDLALMLEAAHTAGEIALGYFGKSIDFWDKDNNSPVSEADIAVDTYIKKYLLSTRENYGWVSEESDTVSSSLETPFFLIDPIDGTRAFIRGKKDWTISLALIEKGRPVVAVLYQPTTSLLYTAITKNGAFLNGAPLSLSQQSSLQDAIIAGPEKLLTDMKNQDQGIRYSGYIASLALRFARVASNDLHASIARPGASDWDIAAADLIVHEAGGQLTNLNGIAPTYSQLSGKHDTLLATQPGLQKPLLSLVQKFLLEKKPILFKRSSHFSN